MAIRVAMVIWLTPYSNEDLFHRFHFSPFVLERGGYGTFVFVDELGELYFRGLEEALRPVMTAVDITTFATAQNFHSKRKTDSSTEQDDRLRALIRRFPRVIETENPSDDDLVRFLARRMRDWSLQLDHPSTLRLLAAKSGGVVGFALRSLIRAIDEPGRRLTRTQVLRDDPDPLNR